jgi:repressor LexA
MTEPRDLTEKQQAIYEYIRDNQITAIPTFREIAKKFGMTVKGAYDHVISIEKKGWLKRISIGSRSRYTIQ